MESDAQPQKLIIFVLIVTFNCMLKKKIEG